MSYITTSFRFYDCWVCGIPFGLSVGFVEAATRQHKGFNCPNGCDLRFGKSKADKLREELNSEMDRRVRAERRADRNYELTQTLERSRSALRGQVTKIKKRVGRGVCPCCNRHFTDIERHMKSKHPDFKNGATCA